MKNYTIPTLSLLLLVLFSSFIIFQDAEKLHYSSIVIDGHSDTILKIFYDNINIGNRVKMAHVDIPKMKEGGLDAQIFAVWPDPVYVGRGVAKHTLRMLDRMTSVIEENNEEMEIALTASDVMRIVKRGKVAAILAVEGGHAIEHDLSLLRTFYRLGVRLMTLTHANTNEWADSANDEEKWGGLTDFGKEVVKEMNRLGMIIDISHVSDKTFYDVLEITSKPVVASHSCVRAICDRKRNITDDMLRALAENGGLIGINFYSAFIDQHFSDEMQFNLEKYNVFPEINTREQLEKVVYERYQNAMAEVPIPPPAFDKLVEHFDYVVKLIGADHVGLGSDFDGINTAPQGMEDVTKLPDLTKAFLKKGYSEDDIKKILGENWLRILEKVTGE